MDYDTAGQAREDIENQTPAPTIGASSVAPSRVPTKGRGRGGRGRRGGRKPRQPAAAKEKEAEKEAEKARKESKQARDEFNEIKKRRYVGSVNHEELGSPRTRCDLFNKAYNHIADRLVAVLGA